MLQEIYDFLLGEYGPQGWWPLTGHLGCNPTKSGSVCGYHPGDYSFPRTDEEVFEVCCGAILTQNAAWPNVEKALLNLRWQGALSAQGVLSCPDLARLIRPAGYFNQKARKLRLFSDFFLSLDGALPSRDALLSLWGVGPETADSMLLYAFKVPSFVVDAYTRRILSNLGLIGANASYDSIKSLFESNLEQDLVVYQEFHALLVEHAKRFYKRREDYCLCPLLSLRKRSLKRTP